MSGQPKVSRSHLRRQSGCPKDQLATIRFSLGSVIVHGLPTIRRVRSRFKLFGAQIFFMLFILRLFRESAASYDVGTTPSSPPVA